MPTATKENILKNIEPSRNTESQLDWYVERNNFIENLDMPAIQQFDAFPLFTSRQIMTRFIGLYELYKQIIEIPGSIIECGTGRGLGTMSFAHLCSIFEPYHYTRKIISFDTFSGFPDPSEKDRKGSQANHMKAGGLNFDMYETLKTAIGLYDQNRALGHIPKVELIKGNLCETLPTYIDDNPHLVVAMLYLDVDLYEPTRDAIRLLKDRLIKNSIIVFDELNHKDYPGETLAVMEALGLPNLTLKRLPFHSMTCYGVIE